LRTRRDTNIRPSGRSLKKNRSKRERRGCASTMQTILGKGGEGKDVRAS